MATPLDRAANSSVPKLVDRPTPPPLDGDTSSQAPPLPASLPLGAAIEVPGYEVQGELGRGGMGVVYLAKKTLMKRPVVLKVVNKALLKEPAGLPRLRRRVARLFPPGLRAYLVILTAAVRAVARRRLCLDDWRGAEVWT